MLSKLDAASELTTRRSIQRSLSAFCRLCGFEPAWHHLLLLEKLDLWRKQASSDAWIEAFCDLVTLWKPMMWAEEQGQIKAGVGPFLDRRQRDRQAYVGRQTFPTRGDKAVRAQSIRGRMALEGLYLPTGAAWVPAFRSELLSFPAGKHDDQVDALGLVGQLLDRILPGQHPKAPEIKKFDSGYRVVRPDCQPGDWRCY